MSQKKSSKVMKSGAGSPVAGRPPLDAAGVKARLEAFEATRGRWTELDPERRPSRPRGARVEAVTATLWQALGQAGRKEVAARLAAQPASEVSPSLVPDLRIATLAFEHAAERARLAETLNQPGPQAAELLPEARTLVRTVAEAAEFFFRKDPELRPVLDLAKTTRNAGALATARLLGDLERLLSARIDGLGPNTGELRRSDLERARELRAGLRPPRIEGVDPEQAEAELELTFAWAESLYAELKATLEWFDRARPQAVRWPSLVAVHRRPPTRKARTAKGAGEAKGEGAPAGGAKATAGGEAKAKGDAVGEATVAPEALTKTPTGAAAKPEPVEAAEPPAVTGTDG
jgi:hypothetical protein